MSISPGTYNLSIERRADFYFAINFKDSTNTPINLTGWTVYSQVWDKARTTKYADFTVTYTNRVNGQISIALTDTQTSSFPDECFYDVLLENTSGIREYYLQGNVYVSEGYTAP